MAENSNLSFFNPAEPLGGKGVIDAPSTDPLNLQPFEGRPALQDPKINFPTPSIISPLELRENIIGSPGTRTAADKGTISPRQKNVSDYQRMQLLASMAFTPDTPKTGVFAYDASHRSNTFYKRYHAYGQEKFDKIGFHPLLNNEANFNANTTIWNDFGRMLNHSFVPLFANGFVAGPKSLFRAMQGDFGTDTNDARIFAEAAAIGQSNKGGLGGFTSNLLMNFAYTAGIVTEAAIEMGVAALLAAPSGGASIGAAGLNLGSRSFTLGRLMGTTSKIKSGLNTTQAINATRNFNAVKNAKIVGTTLSEAQNINNARQIFNWAKIDAGLGSSVGQFLNPLSQLTDGISAGMTASKNLTGWAKTWAITSNTAGGLYRNAVALNASLAEARLEGGMVENDVYYELVQNHYKTNDEDPTNEQLNAFKKQSQAAGMTALAANAGVIYVSNKIVFDNIFGGKNPIGKLMGRMGRKTQDVLNLKTGTLVRTTTKQTLKTTGKVIAKPTVEFIEKNLQNTLKAWYKEPVFTAGKKTIGYFKANILEGLQENTQEIIADATKNYYIESFKNPSLANSQFAYAQFKHAYDQQFTKQGLETFLSGFAMGFPARGLNYTIDYAGRMAERISDPVKYKEEIAKQKTYTQQLVNTLNNTTLLDFYTNPSFHYGSQAELRKQILQSSDENVRQKLIAESVQMESFIKSMTMAMKHNTMDLYYDQFEAYKDLTQAEFEEAFGLKDGEGKDYLANLSQMQERAKNIETRWNEATERFPIPEDIEDMIDSLPANSAELEQVHLMLAAWNEAKTNYVFFNESFTEVEKQIQKTTQAIKTVLSKYNVNLSDIQLLYEPQLLKTELAYLKRDIDLLTGMEQLNEEQQEQLVQAKEKLETLSALNDAIRNQEVSVIDKKDIIANLKLQLSLSDESEEMGLSEEDIESIANNLYEKNELSLNKTDLELEIAFKNYIRTLTQEEDAELDNQVFNQALDEAASEFYNFMKLSAEKKKLAAVINTINDPQGYMDMVERNMLWMKELYDQRRGYYEEMIRKGFQGIEDNAILNKLAEMNIYISSEALEEWSTKNKIPEEFFDQNKEIVIKQGHHRYGEYEGLFVRALQNVARQKRDYVPKDFQDRIDRLNDQRKAALESLPTTEQKEIIAQVDFENKEKVLDKIKDQIPNESFVELTYTENKENKTVILFKDKNGAFRYDNADGNVFDQNKLKFKSGEIYKMTELPDPTEVKRINDEYDAKIAQVRAEGKAYERKTGEAFEDVTVDTPFDKIPEDLKQDLQLALLDYRNSIGQPLGEDASFSEDDIIDFIQNNPLASKIIDNYNKIRRAQELDKDSNYDVPFVDKDGNEIKASELSAEELDTEVKRVLAEINTFREKEKTEEGLTLEETVELNSLQATLAALNAYKEFINENNFTAAQLRVRSIYNKAIRDKQSEITSPEGLSNHYTFKDKVLTRVSNLVKELEYNSYQNVDAINIEALYDALFSKDSLLTEEKIKQFEESFNKEVYKGYTVDANKQLLFKDLRSLKDQEISKDVLVGLFNKYQFEESRALGTYVHNAIESLINNEPVKFDETKISAEMYESLFGSDGIITKLVKEDLKDVMILGTENVLFNEEYAGTMDLVLVDKEGRVFIVDIKTGRESKWKNYKNQGYPSREANTLQLTAYKNLFYNLTGIEATIAILPLQVTYDENGVGTDIKFPTDVPNLLKSNKKLLMLDSNESFGEKSVQTLVNEKIPRSFTQPTAETITSIPSVEQKTVEETIPLEVSNINELIAKSVPEAIIANLTEQEINQLLEATDPLEITELVNSFRLKYMDNLAVSLRDKIFSVQERRVSVLAELQALQSKLNSIEAFLDEAYENSNSNIEGLIKKAQDLEKAFNVRFKSLTDLKSKKAKNTREQIAQARKLLKEEAKEIIALSDVTRKMREDVRTLETQSKDLTNQLKYYQSLQKKYGDVIDLKDVENKIKTINNKLSTIQKVIKVLSALLSKANDLFKNYFSDFEKANSVYKKAIKESGFKPISSEELSKLLKSEDPMDQQKLNNYLDLAKHISSLEQAVNEQMDKVESAEELIKQEDTLLKTRLKEYNRFSKQVLYLQELTAEIIAKDNNDTVSDTLPQEISSSGQVITAPAEKFYGKKADGKPFDTRNGAQTQLARVSAEQGIPIERLIVKAVEGGFGIVENPDVSASSVVTSTFTLPTAQTTNAKADIEAKKADIEQLEKELFEKNILLENWTSVEHGKYINLLNLRGDIEKRDLLRNLEPNASWQLYAVETLSGKEAEEVLNNISADAKVKLDAKKADVKKDRYYNSPANRMVRVQKESQNIDVIQEEIDEIETIIEKAKELGWDKNRLFRQLTSMGYSYALGVNPEAFKNYLEDRLSGKTNIKVTNEYNFFKQLDAELKALEEQQASSETTIQQTITIEELAQQQEAAAIGVGPSKLAREYIDRILNSKTEKEALEIFREAEPQLKPADLPYLQTAGATARKNNQWVDPTKISDIVLAQVAAGDVFMRIEDNILFQAELKEDKIILKQIDGKSSVILSEDNKNQFMRSTDLNKTKPEVKEEPIIVSEESKQLVLNNIDEVSEFIKNSEKLTNLKEEVTSVDLDKLEDDLLNNLDC
jgi:hypothetical protein